jgi:hypothetical protein
MPILGIMASANQSQYISTNSYESISTTTLGSATSTITFSSIPSTYKHLQLRHIARNTNSSTNGNMFIQLNGDTGSNYAWHRFEGYGTGISAGGTGSATAFAVGGLMTGGNSIASSFGVGVLDIIDYSNTNKNKTMRTLTGYDNNGNGSPGNDQGYINFNSSVWMSTSAVNTITITINGGGNFAQYSQFALYGIKG